jgi:hypothetical protein
MGGKVIITNIEALRAKYGSAGLAKIKSAVAALVASDKKKGLKTRLLAIDSPTTMKALGGIAVSSPGSERATKAAIDRVNARLDPDYVLLLGAPDVIPHQSLANPVFSPGDDDDRVVPSDLPYACDAPFSTRISTFLGPTRVVGRLPDVTGGTDPGYLVGLLKNAAHATPLTYADYSRYFALTAEIWAGSTSLSVENIFGQASGLKESPPSGPKWTATELGALSHYINCHGGQADPQYYGQKTKKDFPVAHVSTWAAGKIRPGTVASVECCYGAELYDAPGLDLPLPMANTYLKDGAHGFFGSTTIAYGPADGNDQADIICQVFLLRVVSGASLGRATLEARQAFVSGAAQLDPVNLKTLAQFNLLGDPSIHPVAAPSPDGLPTVEAHVLGRAERRDQLKAVGDFLSAGKAVVASGSTKGITARQRVAMTGLAKRGALKPTALRVFKVRGGGSGSRGKALSRPTSYLLMHGNGDHDERLRGCVVAKLVGGRVVAARTYYRR